MSYHEIQITMHLILHEFNTNDDAFKNLDRLFFLTSSMIGNTFSSSFNVRGVYIANFEQGVMRHLHAKERCEVRCAMQGR